MADENYLAVLIEGNRVTTARALAWTEPEIEFLAHRPAMRAVKGLVAALASVPELDAAVVEPVGARIERLLRHLEASQLDSGLFDSENLASPPDTSFTINDALSTARIARGVAGLTAVAERIESLAVRASEALRTGGVHTPNHRWELSAALLGLHRLTGDERVRDRALEWLAEGIDIDPDGLYSERSAVYAACVTNPSLLTIADLTGDESYRDVVRRNLRATVPLIEDDLSVETVMSRRQDQRERFDARSYLSQFRELAIRDNDATFAKLVRTMIAAGVTEPEYHLAELLTSDVLGRPLPADGAHDSLGGREVTHYARAGLVRVREGSLSVSVFGGSDVPDTGRIASGLAGSAVLVRARSGAAVMRSFRLVPHFFDLGPVRPRIESVSPDAEVKMISEAHASYYLPLAPDDRDARGRYTLENEGRYFAEMSFSERPRTRVEMTTAIGVGVVDGRVSLRWDFSGVDTSWTAEIVLASGGEWSGTGLRRLPDGARHLVTGSASYRVGESTVTIGPGTGGGPRRPARFEPGELISYVGGDDAVDGERLLLSGRTDAPASLTIDFETTA